MRRPLRSPALSVAVLSCLVASSRAMEAPGRTLPLGASTLPERRTETSLAQGVTLTTITRGSDSKDEHWTIQVLIPSTASTPSALAPRDLAEELTAKLEGAGFTPELREERNPAYEDLPPGTLGYGVRVGIYAAPDAAGADLAKLSGLGYRGRPMFTGEDGDTTSGPWTVRVLTIDPRLFRGEIAATHGSSIASRTRLSALAQQSGALAAVNGGFFAMSPADGVTGEPAGLFVDEGKVLSEATNGRVTMSIFNRNTPDGDTYVRFQRLATKMSLVVGKDLVRRVEGINRKPGVIRNCGGTEDTPTDLPRHDFTCTDADELAVITPEFGTPAPSGDGVEAVVDRTGTVTELRDRTGAAVPPGGLLVQGVGAEATWLTSNVRVGASLRFAVDVADAQGQRVRFDSNDSAVNGGPGLVVGGRADIRPVADGLVHPDNPSFLWLWAVRRNPRTMAGVDDRGRILLVTVDGHRPGYSLGLSLVEGARLMIGLGAVSAINLDGGGSTAMVVNGQLVGSPSDPTGERAIGDAIIVK